jgi:hypothetical protein
LRWFQKEATGLRIVVRDARVSIATTYRYLREAINVIAGHVPDLHDVLAHDCVRTGNSCVWTAHASR